MAAMAVAFDFTAGYINIVNFGFAAFVGVGAYTSGLLAANFGISPWIGGFVGAAVAGFVGLLTGMLTLRLRGIYAAVMTWFVGLALMGLARNMTEITRGSLGLNVPLLLDTSDNLPYYYVILGMLFVTLARPDAGDPVATSGSRSAPSARTSSPPERRASTRPGSWSSTSRCRARSPAGWAASTRTTTASSRRTSCSRRTPSRSSRSPTSADAAASGDRRSSPSR